MFHKVARSLNEQLFVIVNTEGCQWTLSSLKGLAGCTDSCLIPTTDRRMWGHVCVHISSSCSVGEWIHTIFKFLLQLAVPFRVVHCIHGCLIGVMCVGGGSSHTP